MSTAERAAGGGDLRERIVEAARDIVGEQGLDGLSMRALAERIGHSPGTIYLYFRDKDELLRGVVAEGFSRLDAEVWKEVEKAGARSSYLERFAAIGRGYARFALEHTGYFRAMFRIPSVGQLHACPEFPAEALPEEFGEGKARAVELLARAKQAGEAAIDDPLEASSVAWGVIHGLTSLYVSGHLGDRTPTHEDFMELIEKAMDTLRKGWEPRHETGGRNGG